MSRNPQLRLADIIEACNRIAAYIDGFDPATFQSDLRTQDAVIRQFEIIGEAVKSVAERSYCFRAVNSVESDCWFSRCPFAHIFCGG